MQAAEVARASRAREVEAEAGVDVDGVVVVVLSVWGLT